MARTTVPITDAKMLFAALTTSLTGTNNDLVFTAINAGPEGNSIRVQYAVAGNNTALSVAVSGLDIIVTVATDGGGAAISTAAQILSAIMSHPTAKKIVSATLAPSNDGTGVVTSLSLTNLAGGRLGTPLAAQVNADSTNNHKMGPNEGNVLLEVSNATGSSVNITIKAPPALKAAGQAVDRVEPVANGETIQLGPFPASTTNQDSTNKEVWFDPSVTSSSLKFRAYRVTPV